MGVREEELAAGRPDPEHAPGQVAVDLAGGLRRVLHRALRDELQPVGVVDDPGAVGGAAVGRHAVRGAGRPQAVVGAGVGHRVVHPARRERADQVVVLRAAVVEAARVRRALVGLLETDHVGVLREDLADDDRAAGAPGGLLARGGRVVVDPEEVEAGDPHVRGAGARAGRGRGGRRPHDRCRRGGGRRGSGAAGRVGPGGERAQRGARAGVHHPHPEPVAGRRPERPQRRRGPGGPDRLRATHRGGGGVLHLVGTGTARRRPADRDGRGRHGRGADALRGPEAVRRVGRPHDREGEGQGAGESEQQRTHGTRWS